MDNRFPLAHKGVPGYDREHVTSFLDRARAVFEGAEDGLTSREIRATVFPLVSKEGFNTQAVDEALWRLEEAFADKERLALTQEMGDDAYYQQVRERAQEILDRAARPDRERFRTVSLIRPGYHQGDVDGFCADIASYFLQQKQLLVSVVRTATFRTAVGGYDEAQVDSLLDETISVMLAVR